MTSGARLMAIQFASKPEPVQVLLTSKPDRQASIKRTSKRTASLESGRRKLTNQGTWKKFQGPLTEGPDKDI